MQVWSLNDLKEDDELKNFFSQLVKACLDTDSPGARLDFLACPLFHTDALEILELLQGFTKVGS